MERAPLPPPPLPRDQHLLMFFTNGLRADLKDELDGSQITRFQEAYQFLCRWEATHPPPSVLDDPLTARPQALFVHPTMQSQKSPEALMMTLEEVLRELNEMAFYPNSKSDRMGNTFSGLNTDYRGPRQSNTQNQGSSPWRERNQSTQPRFSRGRGYNRGNNNYQG